MPASQFCGVTVVDVSLLHREISSLDGHNGWLIPLVILCVTFSVYKKAFVFVSQLSFHILLIWFQSVGLWVYLDQTTAASAFRAAV